MNKIIATFLLVFNLVSYSSAISQWQQTGSYTGNVLPFEIKDSILISGTYGSGVYITTDGTNWNYSSSGMTDLQIISMTVCNGNFYAGSEVGGIYKSTDNGLNWTPVNNGLSNLAIHTICTNDGKIYAGTSEGIHKSTDNGNNWTRVSFSPIGNTIYALESFGDTVFTGTSSGVYYSADNGTTWNNINAGLSGAVYCLMKFGNEVYAGTSNSGIYKTSNCGSVWNHINSGLPSYAIRGLCYHNNKIFAASYGGGVYYSTNCGTEWLPSVSGLTNLFCYSVIQYRNNIFCGTKTGIFKRPFSEFTYIKNNETNFGNTFNLLYNYPNPFNPSTNICFTIDKNDFVILKIYDSLGKEIETIVEQNLKKGSYTCIFNAENISGGIYYYKLTTGNSSNVKKMICVK
jgi:photosystem II stability/assembly factor-like uncharacterized protein